jgi:AraC family transcriptional regulator, transcriptional activator of pobA
MHDRTVVEWISEPRMAEARRLLVETDESVEGIGAQIEYDDPRYFARRFQISHGRPLPHGGRANPSV